MRDKIKEFLVIKLIITLYLSLSFRNLSLQGKLYYLGKTLKSFKRRRFSFWEEIKAPTPVRQPIHFQLRRKPLY